MSGICSAQLTACSRHGSRGDGHGANDAAIPSANELGASHVTVTQIDRRAQPIDLPIMDGHDRSPRHRRAQALHRARRSSPTTRASPRPPPANRRSPISTATKGVLLHRGYPIEELAEKSDFLEVCYLLLYGELPDRDAEGRVPQEHHLPHDAARADPHLLPRLPARCPSDGGDGGRGRRALGLLSRQHRHRRSAPARDRLAPPDRQDADHRGDGLQIFDRPALHVTRATT